MLLWRNACYYARHRYYAPLMQSLIWRKQAQKTDTKIAEVTRCVRSGTKNNPKNCTINGTTKRDSHSIITKPTPSHCKAVCFCLFLNWAFTHSFSLSSAQTGFWVVLYLYFTQWFDFIFIFCNFTLVTVLFSCWCSFSPLLILFFSVRWYVLFSVFWLIRPPWIVRNYTLYIIGGWQSRKKHTYTVSTSRNETTFESTGISSEYQSNMYRMSGMKYKL